MEKEWRSDEDDSDTDYVSRGMSRSLPISSPPSVATFNGGSNYILHTVTKFDTLAGIAIKYGVEVADIKKLNGLVTDLQMFALKTLQIPLPGKHTPSSSLCNDHDTPQWSSSSEQTPSNHRQSNLFDSFQSLKLISPEQKEKVPPAMSSLQGYYGLQQSSASEGVDMNGGAIYLEDQSLCEPSNHSLSHHRKSKSVANGLMFVNGLEDPFLSKEPENSSNKWIEGLLRRHKKSEADFASPPPEKLLKEENSSSSGISSRGLALRPKPTTRIASGGADGESGGPNSFPLNLGDSFSTESTSGVRKSSSTSNLQESDSGALSSLWPSSKWSLKPDFQALSSAAIPIFDGLPKPMSLKNKTALD